MAEAQEMLRRWEAHDTEVYSLWERMNGWVYEGFEATYKALGVEFDKVYHESQTYLLGKSMVEEGLARGVFYRRDDGSVWVDLTADGLDNKLLLRSDGTSVYMTQDIGTAFSRFEQESLDGIIYVVGNEQNYHFQALKLIVARLGHRDWAESIHHLSYGMVELPEGRMKSREGTVVDADDLVASMTATAREMSTELGKLDDATREEAAEVSRMVGMAALKYFILKVDPRKTMLFNPRESIDFNGNTGPFIQYAYARIRSLLRKAGDAPAAEGLVLGTPEVELVKRLCDLPQVVAAAAAEYSPATVASYVYELAKNYNGYYHDHPVLREENVPLRATRLALSAQTARAIAFGMSLLGIELPERM
jgi:arginyl-tRNA synthetase